MKIKVDLPGKFKLDISREVAPFRSIIISPSPSGYFPGYTSKFLLHNKTSTACLL